MASPVSEIFRDLYNIEINLIESSDITSRKMESPSTAMAQIARKYADFLAEERFEQVLEAPISDDVQRRYKLEDVPPTYIDIVNGMRAQKDREFDKKTFDQLAAIAEHVVEHGGLDETNVDKGVAVRILGVSQQLRFVAKKWEGQPFIRYGKPVPDPATTPGRTPATDDDDDDEQAAEVPSHPKSLTDAQRLQIRKAWDVGSDVIVFQTVAQLDGDIVTRVSSGKLDGDDSATLFELHRVLINTSLNHWQQLFDTVLTLAGKAFSQLLRS